jgi:AAA+ superfamily predicted ATPase
MQKCNYFIALSIMLSPISFLSAIPGIPGFNGTDHTINVHLDTFDNPEALGKTMGIVAKEVTGKSIMGITEGMAKVSNDKNFGRNLEKGFRGGSQQAAKAAADALKDNPKLQEEIKRGGKNFAETVIGPNVQGLKEGFREKEGLWDALTEMSFDGISTFWNIKNGFQVGKAIFVVGAVGLTGFYGTRVFWAVLEKKLTNPKPTIVLPGSNCGRWDRMKRWYAGYKTPAMIFDTQVKDQLIEIKEKTKNIRDHIRNGKKTTYDNLLLYGKPGTGKTLFAQILADETDMDFIAVTAASLLQSGVEGIKYFNELLDLAKHSKHGLILFVDEADALFVNRDSLDPASDHYKVLNHILAVTGSGNDTFMLIAATNHSYVMDEAMGRRFQDRVLMPLPDAATRKELVNLYVNSLLFNEKNNSQDFIKTAKSLFTPHMINTIVEKTENMSHAEIKDMISSMYKKAFAAKNGILTATHVQRALQQAIDKHNAFEQDKEQYEQHNQKITA